MPSERVQRQIDRLLDQCEEAIAQRDWAAARDLAESVLRMDPGNEDAPVYLAAAQPAGSGDWGLGIGRTHPLPLGEGRGEGASPMSQPPTDPKPPVPSSFCEGRYTVAKLLGEGGKKRVFLAHDTRLDRDVAFALIKTDGLDQDGQTRIHREAQAMGRLGDHPHIVSVFDIGDVAQPGSDGATQPYIVTQLMHGGDVEGLIAKADEHRLPLGQALAIASQVCQALAHAHSHGIVHRDLKPGNVWLTADGTAKLGDFGLAVALGRTRLTQAGMMVGTVSYMPPEQATGGEVTPQSDLYSLGAMLYEMVCGRPPFVGDETVAIIGQHLNTPPVAPSWHRTDCPPGLEALILRLLEKDAARRPASAAEVLDVLARANAPTPTPPPTLGEGQTDADGSPLPKLGEGPGVRALSPLYRRTFVGRENELRQLRAGFDGASSGQGGLVLVVGEPGIGKTAVCEQLATYAALRGGKALVGHCYEEGSLSIPYLPFVEALRSYVLARDPEGLRTDLGSGAADVARIISEIRDKVGPSPTQDSGLSTQHPPDPEDDRWRLFQAVTSFLRNAAAVQPILLILEDLHWSDRGTLDYLIHLARNLAGARLLIVGTYRDVEVDRAHPLSSSLAELRRAGDLPRVVLRGLTVDEVHRMVNSLQGQEVRWSFAEAVHRQTEGSPLFIQEVLRYLVEEGLISRESGRWRRSGEAAPELSIPEGLRDVIGKRLSRLSPACNRLLTVAAVVGREFALDVLGRVSGIGEDEALAGLEEGLKLGILEEQAKLGSVLYRFSHAFFRQTLYEELSAARRIRLHQEVARALETVHARRLDDHAPELAEHFSHSSDPADLAKAVHYGELGAHRAMAVYAHGEAVRLLDRAIEVQEVLDPDDRPRRSDLLLMLGEALMATGEPQRVADTVAPEVLQLAEELGDSARASTGCRMGLTALERYAGMSARRTDAYRRWGEAADRHAAPQTLSRVLADVALYRLALATGSRSEGRVRLASALELARRLGTPEALFTAGMPVLDPEAPLGLEERLRVARELTRELTAAPRSGVDLFTLGRTLYFAGVTLFNHGDRDGADRLWGELEEMGTRTRDTYVLLRGPFIATIRAILDGRLEEALAATERLRERADELGSSEFGQLWGRLLSIRPFIYLGRAGEYLSGSTSTAIATERPRYALALAAEGRAAECRRLIEERIVEELSPFTVPFLLEAALLIEDGALAASLAEKIAVLFPPDFLGNPENQSNSVGRLLGGAAALNGHLDQAEDYTRQGLAACERARFRPELALCRLQLAEILSAKAADLGSPTGPLHAEALTHLDFAIEELRAMKMQPYLERALRHKGLLRA